jgi:argininosuccinate synthase
MFGNIFNKIMSYFPTVTISYTETIPTKSVEEEPPVYEPPSYEDMTKKELVTYAEEQGITLKMKMTKAYMISVLRNHV